MKSQLLIICTIVLFFGCAKNQVKPQNMIEEHVIKKFNIIKKKASVTNMFHGAKILSIGTIATDNYLITTDLKEYSLILDSIKMNQEQLTKISYFGLEPNGYLSNYKYFETDSFNNINYFVKILDNDLNETIIALIIIYPSDSTTIKVPLTILKTLLNRAFYDDELARELLTTKYEIYGYLGDSLIGYQHLVL